MQTNKLSPQILHTRLTYAELDGSLAADCRRIIRGERIQLGLALGSGDGLRIAAAATEALRVAAMWSVEVAS